MALQPVDENELVNLYPPPSTLLTSLWNSWNRIIRYRLLTEQLVKVNLQMEFKKSFVGLAWLLILPLLAVAVWIMMNRAGVVAPGEMDVPYPAYVLLSTSIWGFFVEIYRGSSNVLAVNGRLFLVAPFPYEAQVVEQVIVNLIRFSIPFGLNILVLLYFGVKFSWVALLFPLSLLPLMLFGLAIGLIVSLFRIVAVDLGIIADEGMRLLMFLTPVIYAPTIKFGWLSEIVRYNPLTYLISFCRDLLTKGTFYEPSIYLGCSLGTVLFFFLVQYLYTIAQPRAIERLIGV